MPNYTVRYGCRNCGTRGVLCAPASLILRLVLNSTCPECRGTVWVERREVD